MLLASLMLFLKLKPSIPSPHYDPRSTRPRLEYPGDTQSCPVDQTASKLDCVVSGVGPTYIDIVVDAGKFEEIFKSEEGLFRLDRFFSPTSHERMCEAVKRFAEVEDGDGGSPSSLPSFAASPIRDCVVGCFMGDDIRVQESAKTLAKPIAGLDRVAAKRAYSVAMSTFELNNSQQSAVALALSRKVSVNELWRRRIKASVL